MGTFPRVVCLIGGFRRVRLFLREWFAWRLFLVVIEAKIERRMRSGGLMNDLRIVVGGGQGEEMIDFGWMKERGGDEKG